jgi:hypothetical protein
MRREAKYGGEKPEFLALRRPVCTVISGAFKIMLVVKIMLSFEPIDRAKKLLMFGVC